MSHQSRYVNLRVNMSKTGCRPDLLVDFIKDRWPSNPTPSILWAVHDERGKELHFHMVVRFSAVTRWDDLFDKARDLDPKCYCESARAFTRSVRYLIHLDNPEKEPISRSCLNTDGMDESELSMLLGAPRTCILHDIRDLGKRNTFSAFDWLVNERGHSPNEVAQVLRCLSTIADWIHKVNEDESVLDGADELGLSDEFVDPSPFGYANDIRSDFDLS